MNYPQTLPSLRGSLCLLLAFAASATWPLASARGAEAGVIVGTVSNLVTGKYLEAATVQLDEGGRSIATDSSGHFRLPSIAAGSHAITVTYPGLDASKTTIDVAAGQTVTVKVELTAAIYKMEAFSVVSEREGNALAIAVQKAAPNIQMVISADAYGAVSDQNVGNLLQRIPDVSADLSIGDAEYIRVRGLDPNMSNVTVDGTEMANEDLISTRREFRMEQFSMTNIDQVQVTKAPTPDMDADSIGGNINLVSKSAFDSDVAQRFGFHFGFNDRLTNHPNEGPFDDHLAKRGLSTKQQPNLGGYYSKIFGPERNIGVRIDIDYTARYVDQEQAQSQYQDTLQSPAYTWQYTLGDLRHTRTNAGVGIKLDYKLSSSSTFSLGFKYNYFYHTNEFNQFIVQTNQAVATVAASGALVAGTGAIAPGYTNLVSEALPGTKTTAEVYANKPREVYAPSRQILAAGKHDFGSWKFDYNLNLSRAASNIDSGPLGGNVTDTMTNVGWVLDRSRSNLNPTLRQTAGANWGLLSSYNQMSIALDDTRNAVTTILGGQFNAEKQLETTWPIKFKSGLRFRERDWRESRAQRSFSWIGPGNVGQFLDPNYNYGYFGAYPPEQYPSVPLVREAMVQNPQWFSENYYTRFSTPLINNLQIRERVSAAYAMGTVDLHDLEILFGVRAERTQDEGSGPAKAEVLGVAAANETPAQAQARALHDYGQRQSASGAYANLFPGIHFKYTWDKNLVARASWTNSVGRQTFDNIIPATVISDSAQTVTTTNPAVKPEFSENFDLSLEYYFRPAGLLSVGAFQKNIKDFAQQVRTGTVTFGADNGFGGQYGGYTLVATENVSSAVMRGIDFNWQQQLTFLPGKLAGLSVYANYTYLSSQGSQSDQGLGSRRELGGFVPRAANAGIAYRQGRVSLRVQGNYRGANLALAGTDPGTVVTRANYTTYNASGEFKLSRNWSIYAEIVNFTSAPENQTYLVDPSRVRSEFLEKAELYCGMRANF